MPGIETENEEARAALLDICDAHTLHHSKSATMALLQKTANVSAVRAVPNAKIAEVLETFRQDIAAAKERKAQRKSSKGV